MRNTIVLILVLLFLSVSILFLRQNAPVQRREPLFSFPIEQIGFISVSGDGDSLFIKKGIGDEWQSVYPVGVWLSPEKVQSFTDRVLKVQRFDKLLTSKPKDFAFYNVTLEKGKRLVLYDREGYALADYLFGMADLTSYGAARSTSEPFVYELAENIMTLVNARLGYWRDDTIIDFQRDFADSIYVSFNYDLANEYKLLKKSEQWYYQDKNEWFALTNNHLAINMAFVRLENYKTNSFIDYEWERYSTLFSDPLMQLTIFKPDSIDTLTFAELNDHTVIVRVNDLTDTLYLTTYDLINSWAITAQRFKQVFEYSL